MKFLTGAIVVAALIALVVAQGTIIKDNSTAAGTTNSTTKLDVHWSNDTTAVKLVSEVSATSIGDKLLNVSAADVVKAHEEIGGSINSTIAAVDKASAAGAHEISNTLNKSVVGNVSVWTEERAKLEAGLHTNATAWEKNQAEIDAAHATAVSVKTTDEVAALKAAIEVIQGTAEAKVEAVYVVLAVIKDSVNELKVNVSKALLHYAQNTEEIAHLKASFNVSVLNETQKAQIEVLVKANIEIKKELAILAVELAKETTVLVAVHKEGEAIISVAKEIIHDAQEKAVAIAEHKFNDVETVKAEISANKTVAEEHIKEGVNSFLENATVTKVVVDGLAGSGNVSVKLDLTVSGSTSAADVKHEIEAGVKIALAAEVGAKPSNITVHVTSAGGKKRQSGWTADAQIGQSSVQNEPYVKEGAATSVVVGLSLLLSLLALFF